MTLGAGTHGYRILFPHSLDLADDTDGFHALWEDSNRTCSFLHHQMKIAKRG